VVLGPGKMIEKGELRNVSGEIVRLYVVAKSLVVLGVVSGIAWPKSGLVVTASL
jgi:hypothetical protein